VESRVHDLGPSATALVRAAEERDIPWIPLNEGSLIQLGYGKYQKRIQATLTSETRHIAVEIASDQRLTRQILGQIGLPVPRQPLGGNMDDMEEAGNDYRILVVDGRVVAAARRVPGRGARDGRDTEPIELSAVDVTDAVHEDNRLMAERAVRVIGLDVGGVDFVSPDISRSYKEAGGAIVGINAAPGLHLHVAPLEGEPRDVAGPVIDMLFPRGTPCRIPLAAIAGSRGKTTTTHMVGHLLKLAGYKVGMATTDGIYIDSVLTVRGDMTDSRSSQIVLRDPSIDAAVLETACGGIVRSGLGWRKCSVGAVLNVASDDAAPVEQIVVEAAQDCCVLNADDERVVRMAEVSPGQPIYVTMDPDNQRVRSHVRAGGQAVALELGLNGRLLVLYQGELQIPLLWARQIPATLEGRDPHNIQNAMFAVAVAHGMGAEVADIREGLRTCTDSRRDGEAASAGRLRRADHLHDLVPLRMDE
jgi:cyanophycin synthetase